MKYIFDMALTIEAFSDKESYDRAINAINNIQNTMDNAPYSVRLELDIGFVCPDYVGSGCPN